VGGCELRLQQDGSAHVSYWTNADERKRGYATHALQLLVTYGQSLGVQVFESHVEPSNVGSRRTSELAGFVASGTVVDGQGRLMIRYVLPAPAGY